MVHEKAYATGWLMVSLIVMFTAALPTISSSDQGSSDSKRTYAEKRSAPANRIQPIAVGPMDLQQGEANSDAAFAAAVLKQYGYYQKEKPLGFLQSPPAGNEADSKEEDEQSRALRLFQSYFGLKQTGKLDSTTLSLMKRNRCGVADILPGEEEESGHVTNSNRQTPSRYALLGSKWDKNRLTWKLDTSSTRQLTSSEQRKIMKEAFETWRRVTPLEFIEQRGPVDIDIKFGSRHHGDDFAFDGKGKVLAHAFGPGPNTIDGDMHFDDEEDWSTATGGSDDLLLVGAHELGHSLGLSHSRDPEALMYPYYGLTDRLGPDDIKAIQSLYGIRIGQPTTTLRPRTRRPITTTRAPRPTTSRPITRSPYTRRPRPQTTTTPPVKECGIQFDVVIQDPRNREIYSGIQGNKIYRFNSAGLLPNYPTHLHAVFPGAPSFAETVFTIPEKHATYFVKDNKVWRYQESHLDPDYPKDLDPTHFPEVIRFVLPIVDTSGYRRVFVFGRTLWWEYNFDNVPAVGSYYRPRPSLIPQYWPAVSSDVNYAVKGTDNYIYLIMPDSHVVLDSFRRAMYGGKQEGHPQWMQPACQMKFAFSGAANPSTKNFSFALVLSAVALLLSVLMK